MDEGDVTPDVPTPGPDDPPSYLPPEAFGSLSGLQSDYEDVLAALLDDWPVMVAPFIDSITSQVATAESGGDLLAIERLAVVTTDLAAWAQDASESLARSAAEHASAEAAEQDVEIAPGLPDRPLLATAAQLSAATLGSGLVLSAAREAVRWWGRRRPAGGVVAERVREHLESLTTAQPEYVLGGMLTGAQRDGRMATARGGPGSALYANEILDNNTCKYCRAVNGRWLGNSDDPLEPWLKTYPVRGYVECLGRDRCRGQIVYVWRGGTDWTKWIEKESWR